VRQLSRAWRASQGLQQAGYYLRFEGSSRPGTICDSRASASQVLSAIRGLQQAGCYLRFEGSNKPGAICKSRAPASRVLLQGDLSQDEMGPRTSRGFGGWSRGRSEPAAPATARPRFQRNAPDDAGLNGTGTSGTFLPASRTRTKAPLRPETEPTRRNRPLPARRSPTGLSATLHQSLPSALFELGPCQPGPVCLTYTPPQRPAPLLVGIERPDHDEGKRHDRAGADTGG